VNLESLRVFCTGEKEKYGEGEIELFPGQGHLSPEGDELRELRRENKRLRMERDISKKQCPPSRRNRNKVRFGAGSP
jgi:transposase-like protein